MGHVTSLKVLSYLKLIIIEILTSMQIVAVIDLLVLKEYKFEQN